MKNYIAQIKDDDIADYVVLPCLSNRIILRIPKNNKIDENPHRGQHRVTVFSNENKILWDIWCAPESSGAMVGKAFKYVDALALKNWEKA